MANDQPGGKTPVTIKKYANRRLYNTASSSYVTLDDLAQMVKREEEFVVYDAKTGEDITRSVLTQIIVEEESKGTNLLPIPFLRQLIGFYGDSLQSIVPKYLEHSMASFRQNQERMREYVNNALEGMFPFGSLEEMSRKNMEFMDQAFRMFNPFGQGMPGAAKPAEPAAAKPAAPPPGPTSESGKALAEMQARLAALQAQIDALTKKS